MALSPMGRVFSVFKEFEGFIMVFLKQWGKLCPTAQGQEGSIHEYS